MDLGSCTSVGLIRTIFEQHRVHAISGLHVGALPSTGFAACPQYNPLPATYVPLNFSGRSIWETRVVELLVVFEHLTRPLASASISVLDIFALLPVRG